MKSVFLPAEIIEYVFQKMAENDSKMAFRKINSLNRFYNSSYTRDAILCKMIPETSMDAASANGNISLLNFHLHNKRFTPVYTEAAINSASANGHAHVLEWWKQSNLPLLYNESAVEMANKKEQFDVLKWWTSSGLFLKWKKSPFKQVIQNGSLAAYEFWKSTNALLVY